MVKMFTNLFSVILLFLGLLLGAFLVKDVPFLPISKMILTFSMGVVGHVIGIFLAAGISQLSTTETLKVKGFTHTPDIQLIKTPVNESEIIITHNFRDGYLIEYYVDQNDSTKKEQLRLITVVEADTDVIILKKVTWQFKRRWHHLLQKLYEPENILIVPRNSVL